MPRAERIKRSLRWGIAVVAMAIVVHQLLGDPEPLRRILRTPPPVLLGLCALVIVNQVLASQRFSLAMSHAGGGGLGFAVWFRLTSVGQMLNLFVPQLGNLYRGVTLKRDYGVSYMAYATGLVSFVWLDMVMGVAIAFLAIALLEPGLELADVSALLLLAVAELCILLGPILAAQVLRRLPPSSGLVGRAQARLTTLLGTASAAARSPRLMLRFFLLNIVVTVGQTATLWLAFHSVGGNSELSAMVLFQILVKISSQVVVTPGNLGITELAYGLLAHGSERTLQQGLAVSLLLRAVGSAMVMLLGLASGGAGVLFGGRRALQRQSAELLDAQPDAFSATKK